jgi:homoserine kinase
MKKVTVRVPATTANLGPGFDAFGCALSLHTDVTFEDLNERMVRLSKLVQG